MPIPGWNDIKDFTNDLLHILNQDDIPEDFRPKLARSIALLRDDKQTESITAHEREFQKVLQRKMT